MVKNVVKFFFKILSNLESWFCSIKIRINSPTIIYNMAQAIEEVGKTSDNYKAIKEIKTKIMEANCKTKGKDKILHDFLKQKHIS